MFSIISGLAGLFQGSSQLSESKSREEQANRDSNKAIEEYSKIQPYKFADLYRPLRKGWEEGKIRSFRVGNKFSGEFLKDDVYEKLSKDLSDENSSLGSDLKIVRSSIKDLVKDGFLDGDHSRLKKILKDQRRQTKNIGDTIVRKSIERGVNPYRAKLMQFLVDHQQVAENANQAAIDLAAKEREKKIMGIKLLRDDLADEYDRKLALTKAKNSISLYNIDHKNKIAMKNWKRENQVDDYNVKVHNKLSQYNNDNYLRAKKNVIDSENKKRVLLGRHFSEKASNLMNDAWRREKDGHSRLDNSFKNIFSLF